MGKDQAEIAVAWLSMRVPEINVALGLPSSSQGLFSSQGNHTNKCRLPGRHEFNQPPRFRSPGGTSVSILEIVCVGIILKPQTPSLVNLPDPQSRTNLSSLFHDGGVGSGVALVGANKSTGAQEAKASRRDIPRGNLVLSWVPSAHAAAHRAGCRERVGLPKATTVRAKRKDPEPQASSTRHSPGCQRPPWG